MLSGVEHGFFYNLRTMFIIRGVKVNKREQLLKLFLPSSLVILGLYQNLDVSLTNFGVMCTASESAIIKTVKQVSVKLQRAVLVLCPIAPLIHSRLPAMVGRSGWQVT